MTSVVGKVILTRAMKIPMARIFTRFGSFYTPNYLELMKPKIPLYPTIAVQIRGYDYPILENYQKLINQLAEHLDIDVDESYGVPAKVLKIHRYKPRTATPEVEYKLEIYERNFKLSNLSADRLPILIRLIEASVPEGVMYNFEEWTEMKEEIRYIPDKQLLDLKAELETMKKK